MSRNPSRRDFLHGGALAAAGAALGLRHATAAPASAEDVKKTRSYKSTMDYRRLGKTGLWVSAVCLGGHWKRVDKILKAGKGINPYNSPDQKDPVYDAFIKSRRDVADRCMEAGINLIDIAEDGGPHVYGTVLQGRREGMYVAYSHPASEMRGKQNRKAEVLVEKFERGLKQWGLGYADVWRCMALERGGAHTEAETEEMVKALETARRKGLCRFTGVSTHDAAWAKKLIETYPDVIQVVVIPYTAGTKELEEGSVFEAIRKHDVGILGIKPFASGSLFQGDSSPGNPQAEEDDGRARLAIRKILQNAAVTAPIPGLVSPQQVDNMARAVTERRELNEKEKASLDRATGEMWARLPADYQWLKRCACV
jgi:aryl-alcohol dehydrogenase-like predicted oxidoreductase